MIEAISLMNASASIVQALVDSYRKSRPKETSRTVELEVDGEKITVSPELIASLEKALTASEQTNSRALVRPHQGFEKAKVTPGSRAEAEIGATALAISPDGTFANARRRSDRVFKLYLVITIALAVIFVASLLGALVSALVFGRAVLAIVFAGATLADVVAALIFQPLSVMKDALLSVQRLDLIHLRLQEQLKTCSEHETLEPRIRCQNQVWNVAMKEIARLQSVGVTPE
jgi:hypothetical protein